MPLDPNDPHPPYLQVANALRAAIVARKLQPGEKLPSNAELATHYEVAKMTITQAIRVLREEGLVISRSGSGTFVRERTSRPISLRPHIEALFESSGPVTLDFAGFSGETLHGALQEPLDKIRDGQLTPESIHVRLLVPDPREPWALPCNVDDLSDSPEFRKRAHRIMIRHTLAIVESIHELEKKGLVEKSVAELRVHRVAPLFKIYVLNKSELFFGFYPVQERKIDLAGAPKGIFDLVGKDATLFHHSISDDETTTSSQYVQQAMLWFESMWTTISYDAGEL